MWCHISHTPSRDHTPPNNYSSWIQGLSLTTSKFVQYWTWFICYIQCEPHHITYINFCIAKILYLLPSCSNYIHSCVHTCWNFFRSICKVKMERAASLRSFFVTRHIQLESRQKVNCYYGVHFIWSGPSHLESSAINQYCSYKKAQVTCACSYNTPNKESTFLDNFTLCSSLLPKKLIKMPANLLLCHVACMLYYGFEVYGI